MKKVIVLSAVLGLGALGMACGETPANNANTKPSTPASTPAPVSTTAAMPSNMNTTSSNSSAIKPSANSMSSNSTMKSNSSGAAPATSPKK